MVIDHPVRVVLDSNTINSLSLPQRAKMELVKELERLHKERTREVAPAAPEGGIGIREAGRKYNVEPRTISNWVKKGLVPVVKETANWKYISESAVADLAEKFHQSSGRGKKTHLAA